MSTIAVTAAGIRGALLAGLLAAALAPGAAVAELPLTLEDPASGATTPLRAGESALHLVLFATWCPPCVDELQRLTDLEARWNDSGYRLVLVAVKNRQTAERLTKFAARRPLPGTLLFDADGSAQRLLEADQVPTHIILDRDGVEVARSGGLDEAIEHAVQRLLGHDGGS